MKHKLRRKLPTVLTEQDVEKLLAAAADEVGVAEVAINFARDIIRTELAGRDALTNEETARLLDASDGIDRMMARLVDRA